MNFELVAGAVGSYHGENDDSGTMAPFLDSDVYKWLEAAGWELAQGERAEVRGLAEPMIARIERAQREDGYLDTFYQVVKPGEEFTNLQWGHELYVAGHLVQAAIAWKRGLDDDRLLRVAERSIARIEAELGPGKREEVCGHPEIEMALVELYRLTGNRRHLDFARTLVERRGHGVLGRCLHGARYWQDHAPVRVATEPAGHAVRQMYLDAGVVDVAVESSDEALLASAVRRWEAMTHSFAYITGGLGAHHRDEAFGAAFELPPDRAYAETCAAIGSTMLSWRLLLATGQERFADLIERTAYNAILAALAADGTHFFYSDPLMRRSHVAEVVEGAATTSRTPWPTIACCPPNLMRFLATFPDMAVTAHEGGLRVHQFVTGTFSTRIAGKPVEIEIRTNYPWDGRVDVTVLRSIDGPWSISIRVPSWSKRTIARVDAEPVAVGPDADRVEFHRNWRAGDVFSLSLDMEPRVVEPDPRIDAIRGCVALERGPIVYAVEDADLPEGASVESLEIARYPDLRATDETDPGLGRIVSLAFDGRVRADDAAGWPYRESGSSTKLEAAPVRVRAIPYFAWGNRDRLGMRIWIPRLD